ncbi:STAS domain-containing protein [Geodermatophilus sp. SYSU D00696]
MTAPILAVPTAQDLGRPLAISTDLRAGRVTVAGELERATAHHLLDVLEALTLSGHHTWTVDAAGITFCDVEGIRVLARAQSLPAAGAGRWSWSGPGPSSCTRWSWSGCRASSTRRRPGASTVVSVRPGGGRRRSAEP